jgi:hypothetical protein
MISTSSMTPRNEWRPPSEVGCLYYSTNDRRFVLPHGNLSLTEQGIVPHFGAPGGVLPRVADARIEGVSPTI